jgi:predicted small integral membrane protein
MLDWIRPIPVVSVGIVILFSAILVLNLLEKYGILESYPRKGFLPIISTPGARFFIGILTLIYIFLIGLVFTPSFLIPTFLIGLLVLIIIIIWG